MKGVIVLGGRQVQLVQRAQPLPTHGQVLIRAIEAGICGSDLHPYRADPKPDARQLVQGHELAGIVEAIGPGVDRVRVGDRVVAYQAWGCGYCEYCASGQSNLCANRRIIGKADRYQKDYSVMPEAIALPLPDEMSFDDGLMLSCAGGTAWAALQKARPSCDDTVVVFGLGPVGLMAVMWARAMGAFVIGVELSPTRLELARQFGAQVLVDPQSDDPVEKIRDLTRGEGATVAFESAGSKAAQEAMLDVTHWSARLVYVATAPPGKVIDPRVGRGGHLGLRTVYGSFTYSMPDWYRMTRTILLHGLGPGEAITHRFPLDKATEAYAKADSGRCGKVIFEWQ